MLKFGLLAILFISQYATAQLIVTQLGPSGPSDKRYEYDHAVLKLALDQTIAEFGTYQLKTLDNISYNRAQSIVENNSIENFIYKNSGSNDWVDKLGFVNFPVDLGVVGYRVFFSSDSSDKHLKNIKNLSDLKTFVFLQGAGWLDVDVLEFNGFEVLVGSNYDGLFKMIDQGRADAFPRGINEILPEWSVQKHKNSNLVINSNLAIYYPLPRFFVTNINNKELLERVKYGLIKTYNNGELKKIWDKYYLESVEFVKLSQRVIHTIENPFISEIDKEYEKYIYQP